MVKAKRKALVFLDYDMLIRHFVKSGAFSELERTHEVHYVFHHDSTSSKQGIFADIDALGLSNVIKLEVPRSRMGMWDPLYSITVLHNHRRAPHFKLRRQLMADVRGWRLTYQYQLLSHPWLFGLARRYYLAKMGVFEPIERLIREVEPDIVFHPSILAGYFINELTQICPRLGIPLVVLMNSWDNPASKSMNTGLPDRLVVWGAQTRRHTIEYMKMPPDHVLEFGAAQFQVYRSLPPQDDATLRREFGVPVGIPVLLYAGVSKSVNETDHLLALDQAIEEGRIEPCHVVYRPHPWRGALVEGERSVLDIAFRHVSIDPHMADFYARAVAGQAKGFELADYSVTARLLRLVRGVISPLSTMLLEATLHGIPSIMFWPGGREGVIGRTIDIATKLPHFAEFWGVPGVQVCTRAEDLVEACARMLGEHQAPDICEGLRRHGRQYVVMDGPSYAERVAALAKELVADREKTA